MPAQLVALTDGVSILVDKPILLLGRHPECDIQIDSRKISRRHCCVAHVNDYLVVRDLDSTNGIRINGVRVVEGKLLPGDELTVGNHRYQLAWDEGPLRPPAVSPSPSPLRLPAAIPLEDDDELLESCDEPVALPDPARGPARAARGAPAPAEADPLVIPENLQLLPGSGSFPGVNRKR
jgi:predicted component of type VI protein secretion system